jgi:hypothetical protein
MFLMSVNINYAQQDKDTYLIKVEDSLIERSISSPLKIFRGEPYKLTTSEGNIELPSCHGVTLILKYKVKTNKKMLRDHTFTEKIYLLSETHDLGLFKYFEKSWKPDADGIWTDVLGLMSNIALPKDYKRILRQELYYADNLFAINLVEFTAEDIKFSVVSTK